MDPVIAIAFWAALFVASHLLISSQSIREGLVNRIGEMPFRGLYSLAALGTLIPLMMIFFRHKHAGAILWYLRDFIAVRALTWLLMLAAFIMLVASLISPGPARSERRLAASKTSAGCAKSRAIPDSWRSACLESRTC